MSHVDLVAGLDALAGRAKAGGGRMVRCPAHDDRHPSLSVDTEPDGKLLLHCMTGCATEDVVAALGASMADLFPDPPMNGGRIHLHQGPRRRKARAGSRRFEARYPDGPIAGHHCRTDDATDKRIWWEPKGIEPSRLALYLSWDLADEGPIVIVEGERATHAVRTAGLCAVGTYGTGVMPSADALAVLEGRDVVLWPDHDEKGRAHMEAIAAALECVAATVSIVTPPLGAEAGWDAADAAAGLVRELVATASVVTADAAIRAMTSYDSVPVEWLWEGWLPRGTVTLFDGNPGEAKSTAMMNLIARVTTGAPWPDGTPGPAPGDVLIITREDDPSRVLRPRLEVAGADLSRVFFLEVEFVLPRDAELLRTVLASHPGFVLVFIDPLFSHVEGKVRTISDNDVRTAVMTPLSDIAARMAIAILAMRHYSKDTSRTALLRGAGSLGGLVGAARMVWSATADPDDDAGDRKLLGVVKSNYARKPDVLRYRVYSAQPPGAIWVGKTVSAIEWLGTSSLSIDDILAEEDHESARSATEVLVAYLRTQGGEADASACAAHMKSKGYGGTTQRSAKKRAGVVSRKAGFDGPWTWCLPEAVQDVQDVQDVADDEGVQGVQGVGGPDRPTDWTSSGEEGAVWRDSAPWTSWTSWTPSGPDQDVQSVQGVQEGGPSPRAGAREGPIAARRPDGSVWCRDFAAHQSEHRSVSADPVCLTCTPKEEPS
jgi:hypothetical protein